MLYVEQSLGPQEEILMAARFHWMYTLHSILWIMFGLALGMGLGYMAIWWDVTSTIRETYPSLPSALFDQAWDQTVKAKGGYLNILWSQMIAIRFCILGAFMVGLYFFAHMMLVKATTEIAVTNERLVYKKGLIARYAGELNIDRIEGVSVHQGVLGRIFGYGRVSIRGMGVGEVMLPPIEAPIEFRKAVTQAQSMQSKSANLKSDSDF